MDIISFLPPSSELNSSSFTRWNEDENSLRLGLSIAHSVHGKVGTRNVEGHADVTYVIQGSKKCDNLAGNLEVSVDAPYIGVQSPDLIRSLMEELRPRTSYSVASVSDGLFDLRGFCYVLGVAAAAGSNNAEFNYDRGLASMRLLAPSWSVPVAGQLTVGPGVAISSREYVTLSYLAYAGGIRSLQLMADLLPDRTARPLQGTELAGFAIKVANNIFSVSQGCASCDHHMEAFFRGMNYSWSLWSHTDEGGWIRRALSTATYPPGAGIVAVTTEEFMNLPLRKRISQIDAPRLTIGLFLSYCGLVPVADAYNSGLPTVCEKELDAEPRPSSFEGLHTVTYEVMSVWRKLVCDRFDLHECSVGDQHSFRAYFTPDRIDRHLEVENFIPFWWIEPSPLVIGDTGALFMPAKRGSKISIPFSTAKEILAPDIPQSRDGRYPRGVNMSLMFERGGLREQGYSYLLSGAYRAENGLGFMEYCLEPEIGSFTTQGMFVDPGETNCADRRWLTPHNPIANPVEGYMVNRNTIKYTYAGNGNDPSPENFISDSIDSLLGYFRVNDEVTKPTTRTHHWMPKAALRLTRWIDQKVDDQVRRIRLVGAGITGTTPIAPDVEPSPPSDKATIPEPPPAPDVPQQDETVTAPLESGIGSKPSVRTDVGETKDVERSA